jgi:hypothetical protein
VRPTSRAHSEKVTTGAAVRVEIGTEHSKEREQVGVDCRLRHLRVNSTEKENFDAPLVWFTWPLRYWHRS